MSSTALFKPMLITRMQLVAALLVMACALLGSQWLKPSRYWADELGNPSYDKLLPERFGAWVHVPDGATTVVNPQQAEMLDKIYSETVSRLYVNEQTGRAIMLSVAYGRDQSTDTQLHTPDMCYASQGFRIADSQAHELATPWGALPTVRLTASIGQRKEPLTYFIRTGDRVTTQGSLDRNLARLAMAIRGYKIDGLLVRVSEVNRPQDTFAVQDQFLVELMAAMSDADRAKLIGRFAKPAA